MEEGVSLERALEIADEHGIQSGKEQVAIGDAAGRVLASDLASKVDDPRFVEV